MSLHKNKLPAQFLERLEKGERHTVKEWSKLLKRSSQNVHGVLMRLRKQGYMYYPVGGGYGDWGEGRIAGIVKNVLESKTETKEVMNRTNKERLTPQLKSAFRLMEKVIQEFPEMLSLVETEANQIVLLTLNRKEELKKLNENN